MTCHFSGQRQPVGGPKSMINVVVCNIWMPFLDYQLHSYSSSSYTRTCTRTRTSTSTLLFISSSPAW